MPLRPHPDVSKADWFAARDEPWIQLCCLGPSGFERYARLFAPVPDGLDVTDPQDVASLEGDLPDPQLRLLVSVLARHTSTPDECFFALWEGYGDIHGGGVPPGFPPEVVDAPRVRIPNRSYLLFAGPLAEAGRWGAADLAPGVPRRVNSPNLMWPADHAWFVATEVDQPWTGVGGAARLVEELLATDGLDVEPVELSGHPPYWRD